MEENPYEFIPVENHYSYRINWPDVGDALIFYVLPFSIIIGFAIQKLVGYSSFVVMFYIIGAIPFVILMAGMICFCIYVFADRREANKILRKLKEDGRL